MKALKRIIGILLIVALFAGLTLVVHIGLKHSLLESISIVCMDILLVALIAGVVFLIMWLLTD